MSDSPVPARARPEAVWAFAVLLLVLLPTAFATVRTDTYETSVQTVLIVGSRVPKLEDRAEHVRLLLATEPIAEQIAAASGLLIGSMEVPDRIEVVTPRRTMRLTATARSPGEAAHLVNTAGDVLEQASGGEVVALGRASPPPYESSVDRLVERLPGATPPAPHPIFVGAVGFAIALLFYLAWLSVATEGETARRNRHRARGRA